MTSICTHTEDLQAIKMVNANCGMIGLMLKICKHDVTRSFVIQQNCNSNKCKVFPKKSH